MAEIITIHYLDNSQDKVAVPTLSNNFKINGDKDIVEENIGNILKQFLPWYKLRERWIEKYKFISKSLEKNSEKDYLLQLVRVHDNPNSWMYNTAQENIAIGCVYSFEIVKVLGEGIFTTGPYLFITGYTFCMPEEIFKAQISLINEIDKE